MSLKEWTVVGMAEAGFTISELIVAMGLGLFVVAVLLGLLARLSQAEGRLLAEISLDRELDVIVTSLREELERPEAGLTSMTSGSLRHVSLPRADCLLYRDVQGSPSSPRTAYGGLRLNRGMLQKRTSARCPPTGCRDCRTGRWTALNDPNDWIVTSLTMRLRQGEAGVRLVELRLTGRRRLSPTLERGLRASFLVTGLAP